ncbi:MAG: glycosyltransferase, partial [Deltaproteobacteria bacterium]|nr:glycosyltransferase [Deltaproteobacteria bacterium]
MKINILSPYRRGGPYQWSEDLAGALNKNGIRARHVHTLPELLASPFFQDCDIVHATVPIPFSLWKKPIVLTMHGDYRRERNVWSRFYPLAIKQADLITVPSEFLKRELGLEKAVVIPNAVAADRFAEGKQFHQRHPKFVTVTNFNFEGKAKGVEILIEILEQFRRKNNTDCSFTIVGG